MSESSSDADGYSQHLANLGLAGDRTSVRSAASSVRRSVGSVGSRLSRSDSALARDMQRDLDSGRGETPVGDDELAKELAAQLNNDGPGVQRIVPSRTEVEDGNLAAAIMHADMEAVERRRSIVHAAAGRQEGVDYVRPTDYKPYFCYGVVAVTCMMMLVELGENDWKVEKLSVNPTIGPSVDTLDRLGAKNTEAILEGDFYRLFTPIVLHAGLVHLLFNLIGLWNIGFSLEREFGHWRIATIFVSSGVVGVLFSAIMLPQQLSVGASGAIFGLFGAAWADLIHNWSLYGGQARCILAQLMAATVINLGIGLVPFLDNFAHVGGFITGMILGFTLLVQHRYNVWGLRKSRKTYQLILQSLGITVIPMLFVVLITTLYTGVDVANECSWCGFISCVPISGLWACDACSGTPIALENATAAGYSISCPDTNVVFVSSSSPDFVLFSDIQSNEDLLIEVCKDVCI